MAGASGRRTIWPRLASSIVAIICLAARDSLQDDATSDGLGKPDGRQQVAASLANYLVPNGTYARLAEQAQQAAGQDAQAAQQLLAILGLVGPDMRPANGFADPANITLAAAQHAWRLMHDHASGFAADRVDALWPVVRRALVEAQVGGRCLEAAGRVARAARQLESWAVKLLNSWGSFPPVGLFEGTLGDIGSFHGCLGVPENEAIRHAHYCSLSFRPVLPTRGDYALIIDREPRQLLDLFDRADAFSDFAAKSHYNHYVYFKLGACFPVACSPVDVQRLARLLARRAILMSGPVKCHSKFRDDYEEAPAGRALQISSQDLNDGVYIWKPHLSGAQLVALWCLGALSAVILAFTIADLLLNHLPKMCSDFASQADDEPEPPSPDEELRLGAITVMSHVIGAAGSRSPEPAESEAIELGDDETNNNNSNNNNSNNNNNNNNNNNQKDEPRAEEQVSRMKGFAHRKSDGPTDARRTLLRQLVQDCSLITNTREFFRVSKRQLKSDILCMNGLRCVTMSWIILAHTIQYNDWSAFGRIYEIEAQLKSLLNQPIFNASYLVDTFFVMSGLLTSYSVFRAGREPGASFSAKTYLVGRYLRLTPQILLVSLLFILLPLSSPSSGPHWSSMTGEYSENCSNNWWVNLLHIQAFYKSGEMCNFVCWWVSVDMFYHAVALAVILATLRLGRRAALGLCSGLALLGGLLQAGRHYGLGLPPNLLSTIPQTGAMWSQMTLEYFWTPVAHLFPFVSGFQLGFLLARHKPAIAAWFTPKRALLGWTLALALLAGVLFGTHLWVVGAWRYSAEAATGWALAAQAAWSGCVAWTIVACQCGRGGFINGALSCRLFVVLGKASYLVYLSHFLVLFTFFGSQNFLLEPTQIMITYIILGNVCLSMALGSFLCVAFEMPWLKLQKRIMRLVERL